MSDLVKDNDYFKSEPTRKACWLNLEELELIAHLIYNYEQNFHDRRAENHALGTKIDKSIEELEWREAVKYESEAHDDEL
tara:strand:+ start:1565 stop:1804 length:240 start_codon:yes stop_codon:yes gene_type:complete